MTGSGAAPAGGSAAPAAERGAGARVAAWLRARETAEHGGTLWLALLIGIALLLPFAHTTLHPSTAIFILAACLALSVRWRMGWLAIVVVVALGVWMRQAPIVGGYSDVLPVTRAAIARMLAGRSPYGVGYDVSMPPGAPFHYGPVALLWYLPFRDDPRRLEFWVAVVVLLLLGVRGRPLGLALYAFSPTLIGLTADGSNDTSAGFFLLIALLVIPRAPSVGGLLLAVASAFKLYLLAWLPALVFWSGTRGLAGFLVGTALTWGGAAIVFGPTSLVAGARLTTHMIQSRSFWSLGWLVEWWSGRAMSATAFNVLRIVLGAVAAVATGRGIRRGRDVVAAGIWVFVVALYTGYWSSFSYLAAIAPVVCWHLDDWIGVGDRRVRWPGGQRVASAFDRRWPVLATAPGRPRVAIP